MRLVLRLKSLNTASQQLTLSKYFSAMHGWIYKKLENSDFNSIYESKSYKPFCFSNLYPVKNQKIIENNNYNIIISTPIPKLIETLFFNTAMDEKVNLGELSFKLEKMEVMTNIKITPFSIIETPTFINITVKKNNKATALDFNQNKNLFLEQLSKNLINKYNFFTKSNISTNINLFSQNVLVEPILKNKYALPLVTHDQQKFLAIGHKLRFKLGNISDTQQKVFNYCFDLGFGEKNTYGLGFMIRRFKK